MKKKNRSLHFFLIIIIILFLILIYLFHKIPFGFIGLIPTGNIDIFNIECNKKDDTCNCNGNTGNSDDNPPGENTTPVYGENNGGLTVYDDVITWNSNNRLRIFSNPAYEFKNIIAPGTKNAYQFVISNNNNFSITYKIKFLETNPFNINMKYKLKKNGEYILGSANEWVNIDDIEKTDLILTKNTHDVYNLLWKWVDNDKVDTVAGFDLADYNLDINIMASSI